MIVVDSNIWISALLIPASVPARVLAHVLDAGAFAVSRAQISEIEAVLGRPKFRRRIDAEIAQQVLERLHSAPWLQEPTTRVTDCRDPKDNMLLEIALASGAETIISGDDDLLTLDPWRGRRIVTPRRYLDSVVEPAKRP